MNVIGLLVNGYVMLVEWLYGVWHVVIVWYVDWCGFIACVVLRFLNVSEWFVRMIGGWLVVFVVFMLLWL